MKSKLLYILAYFAIALIPFKLAYLTPGGNNSASLVGFLIVALGAILMISISSFGGSSRETH
jgi:uncharacterized membrane protein